MFLKPKTEAQPSEAGRERVEETLIAWFILLKNLNKIFYGLNRDRTYNLSDVNGTLYH